MSVENNDGFLNEKIKPFFEEYVDNLNTSDNVGKIILQSKCHWRAESEDPEYKKYKKWLPELLKSLNL